MEKLEFIKNINSEAKIIIIKKEKRCIIVK